MKILDFFYKRLDKTGDIDQEKRDGILGIEWVKLDVNDTFDVMFVFS